MTAYYNEIDPFAAEWLRELIKAGHIAPGEVDTRSIEDVVPGDLRGFTQCHFFAGIGVWSYALRQARWPDDRPVWTGSCPCQPFSAAGKGNGFADERHLWPAFHHLIRVCRPPVVFGEQVASKDGLAWLDLVHADMEGEGYAVGAVDSCSAGFGAPHIRQRLYWVADSTGQQKHKEQCRPAEDEGGWRSDVLGRRGVACGVADALCAGLEGQPGHGAGGIRQEGQIPQSHRPACPHTIPVGMADAECDGQHGCRHAGTGRGYESPDGRGGACGVADPESDRNHGALRGNQWQEISKTVGGGAHCAEYGQPRPTNGFWGAADWLLCRDGKWRPVSAGPQPLADGVAESLGRVCDACVLEVEEEINAAAMEAEVNPDEAMRDLWRNLIAETRPKWSAGRIPGLHEAPFLLSFLRQLAEQGWGFKECLSVSCEKTAQEELRMLWAEHGASCPPHRCELAQQRSGKYPDTLRVLSSVLARHAHKAWGFSHKAYAESCFPLTHGAANRVGRLRGYGNAINALQAQAFIEAFMETKTRPS